MFTFTEINYMSPGYGLKIYLKIKKWEKQEYTIIIISSRKSCTTFLALPLRKLFVIVLPLLFKKWVGLLDPSYFVDDTITSHGIALTIPK